MTTTYRRSPAAIWRASGSWFVAAVAPNAPTRMVGSAGLVWQQLASPASLDDIVEGLAAVTGGEATVIRADVQALLAELVPLGLVEVLK